MVIWAETVNKCTLIRVIESYHLTELVPFSATQLYCFQCVLVLIEGVSSPGGREMKICIVFQGGDLRSNKHNFLATVITEWDNFIHQCYIRARVGRNMLYVRN